MSLIRILGIGSPHGDDELGWRAIDILGSENLSDRLSTHRLELLRLDRPGPRLIEHLTGANLVVIVDAMTSGSAPGTVRRLDLNELETVLAPVSSHGLDLPASLALADALGMVTTDIVVVGIEIGMDGGAERASGTPDFAERLSAAIEYEIERWSAGVQSGSPSA